jgi:hypothetical protein
MIANGIDGTMAASRRYGEYNGSFANSFHDTGLFFEWDFTNINYRNFTDDDGVLLSSEGWDVIVVNFDGDPIIYINPIYVEYLFDSGYLTSSEGLEAFLNRPVEELFGGHFIAGLVGFFSPEMGARIELEMARRGLTDLNAGPGDLDAVFDVVTSCIITGL